MITIFRHMVRRIREGHVQFWRICFGWGYEYCRQMDFHVCFYFLRPQYNNYRHYIDSNFSFVAAWNWLPVIQRVYGSDSRWQYNHFPIYNSDLWTGRPYWIYGIHWPYYWTANAGRFRTGGSNYGHYQKETKKLNLNFILSLLPLLVIISAFVLKIKTG